MKAGTSWITIEFKQPSTKEWVFTRGYPLDGDNAAEMVAQCFADLENEKRNGILPPEDYRIGFKKIPENVVKIKKRTVF